METLETGASKQLKKLKQFAVCARDRASVTIYLQKRRDLNARVQ